MRVNGKVVPWEAGEHLQQFLLKNGYDAAKVAVECNGQIVPRREFADFMLNEGDQLEIVSFVGGG